MPYGTNLSEKDTFSGTQFPKKGHPCMESYVPFCVKEYLPFLGK